MTYRMLQVMVGERPIPEFEITDRKQPFDRYLAWYRAKVLNQPSDFNRYCYAKALYCDMQTKPAMHYLDQCASDEIVTKFFRAVPLLLEGRYAAGLPLREYRLLVAHYPLHNIAPQWDGRPTGKRLIIWQEGGFGDVIQYSRYFPQVLRRAPNTIAVIDRSMHPLIRYNFPAVLRGLDPGDFQLQCSMMSLPHLLGEYEQDTRPYLKVPPEYMARWSRYRDKIGFCSKGNPLHSSDPLRSLTTEEAAQIKQDHWCSLEPEDTQAEDWADTAGIIANLELVVTVDTAVAHLAGALGKPVLVMMNKHHDWRWSRSWYDSMRVFRCIEHSDWQPVFDAVKQELCNAQATRKATRKATRQATEATAKAEAAALAT